MYILATVLGVANTFDGPGRRTLVNELVPGEHVSNAVSLSSTIAMGTRIIGPAFAGLLIATVGIGWCFLLNGVSFVVAIAGLWMMDTATLHARPPVPRAPGQVRAGLRYAWRTPPLRQALLLLLALGAVSMNFHVTLALYVKIGLGGSDGLYAALSAVSGCRRARRRADARAQDHDRRRLPGVDDPRVRGRAGAPGVLARRMVGADTAGARRARPARRPRQRQHGGPGPVGAVDAGPRPRPVHVGHGRREPRRWRRRGWSADRFGAAFTVAYGALFTFVLGLGTLWAAQRGRDA